MPRFFNMGNICPTFGGSGSQHRMDIPRNLNTLLEGLREIDVTNLDLTIERNRWARLFRDFVEKRDEQFVINFKFLIFSQAIIDIDRQLNESNLSSEKQALLSRQQKDKARRGLPLFFVEDKEISLSNGTLYEYMREASSKEEVSDKDLRYIREARKDATIWMEGLEPEYIEFLKQPRDSFIACLLSIL